VVALRLMRSRCERFQVGAFKLAKTSNDTALRDIQDLVEKGILVRDEGGGRSTSYSLVKLAGA